MWLMAGSELPRAERGFDSLRPLSSLPASPSEHVAAQRRTPRDRPPFFPGYCRVSGGSSESRPQTDREGPASPLPAGSIHVARGRVEISEAGFAGISWVTQNSRRSKGPKPFGPYLGPQPTTNTRSQSPFDARTTLDDLVDLPNPPGSSRLFFLECHAQTGQDTHRDEGPDGSSAKGAFRRLGMMGRRSPRRPHGPTPSADGVVSAGSFLDANHGRRPPEHRPHVRGGLNHDRARRRGGANRLDSWPVPAAKSTTDRARPGGSLASRPGSRYGCVARAELVVVERVDDSKLNREDIGSHCDAEVDDGPPGEVQGLGETARQCLMRSSDHARVGPGSESTSLKVA